MIVVEAHGQFSDGTNIPRHTGPFESEADAEAYMATLAIRQGTWWFVHLSPPGEGVVLVVPL